MIAIIFDLDNTLYDAGQYFDGASRAIAGYLSARHGLSPEIVYDALMGHWRLKTSMYPRLFNDVLQSLGVEGELQAVIDIFNAGEYPLTPYPDVGPTLELLKEYRCLTGVITDGHIDRQRKKLSILGLSDAFDAVVYTKALDSPKPSDIPYREMIRLLGADPQQSCYVGDNPAVDFEGAKRLGMSTVRVKKGEFSLRESNAFIDHEINEMGEILEILEHDT